MKMKLNIFVLILLLIPALAIAASPQKVTAPAIAAEIEDAGAKMVLIRYYDTPVWSEFIMPGIKSATAEWLSIAQQFSKVSDGAASEDIGLALYEALAVNPFRVLPVLRNIYGGTVEERCTISFEAELPKEGVTKYLRRIETKLKKAKTKAEKIMAKDCLRGLESSRKDATAQGLK
jgi:hypothetical protein